MITINGEATAVAPNTPLLALVPREGRGVAVARNGEVVPRSEWATTAVSDGDRIEILEASPGG